MSTASAARKPGRSCWVSNDIMDRVPWNRVYVEEFLRLAIVTPEDEKILRTRAAGWSQIRQCDACNISLATLNRRIKKLKNQYASVQKYSKILPKNIEF